KALRYACTVVPGGGFSSPYLGRCNVAKVLCCVLPYEPLVNERGCCWNVRNHRFGLIFESAGSPCQNACQFSDVFVTEATAIPSRDDVNVTIRLHTVRPRHTQVGSSKMRAIYAAAHDYKLGKGLDALMAIAIAAAVHRRHGRGAGYDYANRGAVSVAFN